MSGNAFESFYCAIRRVDKSTSEFLRKQWNPLYKRQAAISANSMAHAVLRLLRRIRRSRINSLDQGDSLVPRHSSLPRNKVSRDQSPLAQHLALDTENANVKKT
ncbi:hypothetical protein E8E14_004153 [Neopestalotiopsis sp. 37M]|nr:hypothetical protein E8E14_004153 [Neopestalotiopsis sp. 37M]